MSRGFFLVCFDVSDDRIRYRVVKALKGVGIRVQKSVFECAGLGEKELLRLKDKIDSLIDHETDSVRYYRLCKACLREVEWSGVGERPDNSPYRVI
jgi:CRISPR-associated protein Cas2